MTDMLLERESLAVRVHRLQIRAELSDLVARYGQLLDARNWDELAESFATGGTLAFAGGSVTAREALKVFYAEQLGRYDLTFHYPHSQLFEIVDDEHAHGIVSGHAERGMDGTCILAGVRYTDDYVREDGRWRFGRREIGSRYFLSWPEFADSFREGSVTSGRR